MKPLYMLAMVSSDELLSDALKVVRTGVGRKGFSQAECVFVLRAYGLLEPWQQLYLKHVVNSLGKL